MSKGFIALHRILFEKPIWLESSPEQKVILISLLGMVNHAPRKWEWKGQPYLCQAGQKVTSVRGIQRICGKGITRQNIRTALKRFEKLEFLTTETTKQGMLLTVCNWGLYQYADIEANHQLTKGSGGLIKSEQDSNHQANHPANQDDNAVSTVPEKTSETTPEKLTNESTKGLTFSQPSPNHQLTTNNNEEQCNNVDKRERAHSKFIKPTPQEVTDYAASINFQLDGERFVSHYEANGWMRGKTKIRDWKAAVRYWKSIERQKNGSDKISRQFTTGSKIGETIEA